MNARRTLALVAALGASALTVAVPATAAPALPAAVQSAVNSSTIDPNATTTLDIHKYLGSGTAAGDGTVMTPAPGLPPLQGVVFDVYQVAGVDLTTNAGWQAATDLQGVTPTAADIAAGKVTGKSGTVYTITKASSVTTDATGSATYTGKVGLYLVNENLGASTTITNTKTNTTVDPKTVTPAMPFLVTLPMTNPAGNAWMYDVNVYPKNSSDSMTKTVTDQGEVTSADGTVVPGTHTITYGLSGTVSTLPANQIGTYEFVDTLPTGTTYQSVTNVMVGSTALAAGDYTVTQDATDPQKITIALTQSGIDKMAAAAATDPTTKVTANINVTSNLPAGSLVNTATLIPNNTFLQNGNGIPSNTVTTKIGNAVLTKTDAKDSTKTLSGAKFDLYELTTAGDLANPKPADCTNVVTDSKNMVMTGITTGTDGTVKIDGLQQSDFYNNTQQPATGGQYILYCLVETQAPTGYNLNAQPTAFYITDSTKTLAVSVQDELTNLSNSLPLTGGAGAGALSLGGLVVVGATLAARAASRKRREQDEENELA